MTRYELFRRRIAPILFLGMVGLIAYDSCQSEHRTHATIVIDLGDSARDVSELDAELRVAGEVVGKFHRRALPGQAIGRCAFDVAVSEATATVRVDVEIAGTLRSFERTVRPVEGSTVTVPLATALR